MGLTWNKVTWFPNGVNQVNEYWIGDNAGDHTVPGIIATDQIAKIRAIEFVGGAPTNVHDLTSEFSVTGDDTLNNAGGTDTSNMLVIGTFVLGYRRGS